MEKRYILRIIFDIVLVVSVIWGFWMVALPVGLIGFWLFPYYVEVLVAGFIFDALFGLGRGWGIWGYAGIITTTISLTLIHAAKHFFRR